MPPEVRITLSENAPQMMSADKEGMFVLVEEITTPKGQLLVLTSRTDRKVPWSVIQRKVEPRDVGCEKFASEVMRTTFHARRVPALEGRTTFDFRVASPKRSNRKRHFGCSDLRRAARLAWPGNNQLAA